MITIVISDDEKLIRAGIRKILNENVQIPLNILEAKNGLEALELIQREKPEVLITDIRMPCMDGVELMKQVSLMKEKPGIIVLSGFDDFSYAKAAISSGALSYILKPVDKKELIAAVTNAIEISRQEEKSRNEETLKAIAEEGRIESSAGVKTEAFKNGYYCVSVAGEMNHLFLEANLKEVIYYELEKKKNFSTIVIPVEALFLVTGGVESYPVTVGVSNAEKSLTNLKLARKQSFSAYLQSFFCEESDISTKVFYYKEPVADFSHLDTEYEKIIGRLDISKPEEIQKGIDNIFSFETENAGEKLYYLYQKILGNLFSRYTAFSEKDLYLNMKSIMIENIWLCRNFSEWKIFIRDYCIYLGAILSKGVVEYPFIEEALDYINTHFTKNINMAIVANQVSVNYTWFSEKFKEHTGINFNEYLKNLRIEEAKRLLEKDCYKVYEVAERSGFSDVKYFMKTFRQATGKTPTEWKKTN